MSQVGEAERAARDLKRKQRILLDAHEHLDDLLESKSAVSEERLTKAKINIAEAKLRLAEAKLRLAEESPEQRGEIAELKKEVAKADWELAKANKNESDGDVGLKKKVYEQTLLGQLSTTPFSLDFLCTTCSTQT